MAKILFERRARNRIGPSDHVILKRLAARRADLAGDTPPMAVFAHDHIGAQVMVRGAFEAHQLDLLFAFLEPLEPLFAASGALDIGANIGNHARLFAARFASLHAFEPHPDIFPLLDYNLRHYEHAAAHRLALGDRSGTVEIRSQAGNMGGSSIGMARDGDQCGTAPMQRLDDVDVGTDIALVKIDVEGHERQVIDGASQLLAKQQPLVVFEQLESEFAGGRSRVADALADHGYRFCWFEPLHRRRRGEMALRHARAALGLERDRVVTGDRLPVARHEMVIAVPPRFAGKLGMEGAI